MQPTLIHEFCAQPTLWNEDILPANEEIEKTREQQTAEKTIGQQALFATQFEAVQDTLPGIE